MSGVTKIVEAEAAWETDYGTGTPPLPAEGGAAEGSSLRPAEDQAVRPLPGEPCEVLLSPPCGGRPEGRRPGHRVGLGLAGSTLAVGPLRLGGTDADHQVVEVDVTATEADQLLGAHGAVRAEADQLAHRQPNSRYAQNVWIRA